MSVQSNFGMIQSLDELKAVSDKLLSDGKTVAFDVETGYSGVDTEGASLNVYNPNQFVCGFSFTNDVRWARYVPVLHDFENNLDPNQAWEIFKPVLETLPVTAHNMHFEYRNLIALDRKGHGPNIYINQSLWNDTMLQSYVLSLTNLHGLKHLSKFHYDYDQAEIESLFEAKMTAPQKKAVRFNVLPLTPPVYNYACDDSVQTLKLDQDHRERALSERGFIYNLELEILGVLIDMTEMGVSIDWEGIDFNKALFEKFYQRMEDRTRQLFEQAAGRDLTTLNFRSAQQMRQLLFSDLGLSTTRKTKAGAEATSEAALEALRHQHPAVEQLLMYRQTKKMGEWFELWSKLQTSAEDGKVHPNLNQVRIQSGRFASNEPNIQNIRKKWFFSTQSKEDEGLLEDSEFESHMKESGTNGENYWAGNARDYIISSPGYTLLSFDYSQQELRVLAGLSQEPFLLNAFEQGIDIHKSTAALMFNTPMERVTDEQRQKAKTINFGLVYGQGAKALGEQMGVSQEEAERLVALYFSSYSKVDQWFAKVKREGHKKGYTESFMGRKATVWELKSDFPSVRNKADRMFVNLPVQGGGADITKLAMVRVKREMVSRGWWMTKVRLLMNQHDSLVFEVQDGMDLTEVKDILEPLVSFKLKGFPKFAVDWEYGHKWGSLTKMKDSDSVKVQTAEQMLCIKFDQMPSKEIAGRVLQLLAKHPGGTKVRFVVGDQFQNLKVTVDPSQDLIMQILDKSGATVGMEPVE